MNSQSAWTSSTLGSLPVLVRSAAPHGLLGRKTVLLCHGYGASAQDLAPLAEVLDPDHKLRWVFPQAPVPLDGELGQARAWFPVDLIQLAEATKLRPQTLWVDQRPAGLDEAQMTLGLAIADLAVDPQDLVIGGFSQGSMVSLDWVLSQTTPPAAVMVLAGTLLDREGWLPRGRALPDVRFIQTHGQQDPLLPFGLAQELSSIMTSQWNWQGRSHFFSGGHEIPSHLMNDLRAFVHGDSAKRSN